MMVPTYEGVQLALLHGLKLMAMVSAVACLLSSTPKQEMIGGFYQLLGIFSSLGVLDRERFSARLWLTLHYVEQRQLVLKPSALMEYIKNDTQSYVSHDATIDEVTLQIRPFNIKDLGVLFVLVTLGLLAIGSHL
jgi:hypothetical protein